MADEVVPGGSFWQPRLFSVREANALVPKLLEVFARVRAELERARREEKDPEELVLPLLTEIVEIGIEVKSIEASSTSAASLRTRASTSAGNSPRSASRIGTRSRAASLDASRS